MEKLFLTRGSDREKIGLKRPYSRKRRFWIVWSPSSCAFKPFSAFKYNAARLEPPHAAGTVDILGMSRRNSLSVGQKRNKNTPPLSAAVGNSRLEFKVYLLDTTLADQGYINRLVLQQLFHCNSKSHPPPPPKCGSTSLRTCLTYDYGRECVH